MLRTRASGNAVPANGQITRQQTNACQTPRFNQRLALQFCGGMFEGFPGLMSDPVCEERTACRVPALGKTTCQKSFLGEEKPTPMNLRSCFSRTDVTKHSTDSDVISLKTRTVWPGNRGTSITISAP